MCTCVYMCVHVGGGGGGLNIRNKQLLVYYWHGLNPRPFPPPVFDHLQYANMEEEGLGDLVTFGDIR